MDYLATSGRVLFESETLLQCKILAIDVIKENLVELNLKSTRIQTIDETVVMIKFYQTPSFK